MSKYQGRNRLISGFSKKLNIHEIARGYIFLTRDPSLTDILRLDNFDVILDGTRIKDRSIDAYGRSWLPRETLKVMGRKTIHFQVKANSLLISTK